MKYLRKHCITASLTPSALGARARQGMSLTPNYPQRPAEAPRRPEGPQTCALGVDRGTSMATPVVAGAAALARQYFAGGWYPAGAPQAASAFAPSAPLLKAVLLGAHARAPRRR